MEIKPDRVVTVVAVIVTIFMVTLTFQPTSKECRAAVILQSELTETSSVMFFQYDDQEIVRSETNAQERHFRYQVGDRVEVCNYVGKIIKARYSPFINEER